MADKIESIQTGTATISSSGSSTTASVTAVVANKTFLAFTYRTDSTIAPEGTTVRGYFNSTTQLGFEISGTATTDIIIEWRVVEYTSDSTLTVQEVTEVAPVDGDTTTITSVTVADTWLNWSWDNNGTSFSNDDGWFTELTNATTLTYISNGNGNPSCDAVTSYVITSSEQTVQQVSAVTQTSTSFNITLTAVVLARSFASGSHLGLESGDFIDNANYELTGTTTLNVSRDSTGGASMDWYVYIIELPSTWGTQWNEGTIATSGTSTTISFTSVDTAKTFEFSAGSAKDGLFKSQENGDDYGSASATLDLTSSTQVTATRVEADASDTVTPALWLIEDQTPVAGGDRTSSIYAGVARGVYQGVR